jgi:nucleoside 2-deoxyribosyltransferase
MLKIYWANSLFGEADRAYNDACVAGVRKAGHFVINPQENNFNTTGAAASAAEIFARDTKQITECDVVVACIDQESIDSGVACEIGIASVLGKRIYGLYTDFRQFRQGEFRMYKNPYVIGCIESKGKVFTSLEALLEKLESIK